MIPPTALTITSITFTALHINTRPQENVRDTCPREGLGRKDSGWGSVQADAGDSHAGIRRVLGHQKSDVAVIMSMSMSMSMVMVMVVQPAHDADTFQKLFDGAWLCAPDGHDLAAGRVHAALLSHTQAQRQRGAERGGEAQEQRRCLCGGD